MFKKQLKSILAIALALIIGLSLSISVLAQTVNQRSIPEIYVHGFMATSVYVDPEDESKGIAWPPSTDSILTAVKGAIVPITKLMFTNDWDTFADELVPLADEIFKDACADFNGDIVNGSGVAFEYPAAESVTKNSSLTFYYDWRQDPLKTASELNDFIDFVCEASGSDKVNIQCHSMGGVITLTYLTVYGKDKIQGVLFDSTAIYGESYTGELFTGNIELSSDSILSFMKFVFDQNEYENILNGVFELLDKSGVLPFVCSAGNRILAKIYDRAIISVMRLFCNWSTVWAMVPDEYIDEAMDYVFGTVYPQNNIEFDGLKEKVEAYNSLVRSKKAETLRELNENANVYVISRYGYSAIPITPAWNSLSDSNVDTKNGSFGATTAPYGEALDVSAEKYISPDKTVDASTCLFPEQTWFIKDIGHSTVTDAVDEFYETLLNSETQATVDTFEQYPQFMKFNAAQGTITADDSTPLTKETVIEKLKKIFAEFIKMFKKLFKI